MSETSEKVMDNINIEDDYQEEDDFYTEENLEKITTFTEPLVEESSPITKEVEPKIEVESETELEVKDEAEDDSSTILGDAFLEDEQSMAKVQTLSLEDLGDVDFGSAEDDGNTDDVLSPEERLRSFADTLLSSCIGQKGIQQYALDKLLQVSDPMLFRDENYILFSVMYSYRGKLKLINIDEEFLKLYLTRNRGMLQKSRGIIDINAYGEIDGSVELGYISGVLKHYKRLLSMPEISQVAFETNFEKYLIEFKALETNKAYKQAQLIISDGLEVGNKKFFGFEDSMHYIKRRLAEIEGLANMQKGSGFTSARQLLLEGKESAKSYKISDFDKLKTLNDAYGGIYSGIFYQVIAGPKAGKTKFCTRVAHTTAIKYGNNITVWAVEGGNEAFLAELRGIHFDYMYNTGVSATERKYGVSQDVILHDKFTSNELRSLELSSKLDLASNTDYGNIDFIERPFEVETFLEDIDTSVKSNNSKLVVIDYLQLIGSSKNLSERERVSEAYKKLLVYCRLNNISVLTPGQYKQDTFEALMAKGTSDADMRTAGGTSSEVLRTPDIIFAFWATTQDLLNNTMKILSVPCRFNKPFPEVPVITDLEVCQFISVSD